MQTDNEAGKLSTEDAIIEYLSKKTILDNTEKLALARISSKMNLSTEQAEMTINRLSAKNFIRKIYLQGKVGFELTPKGKSAIDELAKAETARITKQLQEAISAERKAKLRFGAVNKMKSTEEKWRSYQVPDEKLMAETEAEAQKLLAATKEVQEKKPLCHLEPESYDQTLSQYRPLIENLTEQNRRLIKAINDYAKIRGNLKLISEDIENIRKTISKYELIAEAAPQVNQLKAFMATLKLIQSQLEHFDKDMLGRFEEFEVQLGVNFRLLETLKRSTHEFKPINSEILTEKTSLVPGPEGAIKYSRKTSEHPLEEKCIKCGAKRRLTTVDIG